MQQSSGEVCLQCSLNSPWLTPPGALNLGWPFRVAPNWSKRAGFLYPHMDELWGVGWHREGGLTCSQAALFRIGQLLQGTTLLDAGEVSPSVPKATYLRGTSQHPLDTGGLCSSHVSLHIPCLATQSSEQLV